MNMLVRSTLVLGLTGLLVLMASGTLFAQKGILNWDKTHPLEYHQAAVAVHESAQNPEGILNWDKTHPLEYHQAAVTVHETAQSQEATPKGDKTLPLEYRLSLPTIDQLLAYLAVALPPEPELEDGVTCTKC